jgi:hypothetical protein
MDAEAVLMRAVVCASVPLRLSQPPSVEAGSPLWDLKQSLRPPLIVHPACNYHTRGEIHHVRFKYTCARFRSWSVRLC